METLSMPKQAKKNGQDLTPPTIQVTFDYSAFDFFDSNRVPTHWEKVAESIQERNLSKFNPIMVVERGNHYAIIDGQNRYMACKSLGLPIYFIDASDSMKEHDMAMLNSNQKNWAIADYIRHYAAMSNPIYQQILETVKPLSLAVKFVGGNANSHAVAIRNGSITRFLKSLYFNCDKVYDIIVESRRDIDFKRATTITGIKGVINNDVVDVDELIYKIQKYPDRMYKCTTVSATKDMLTDLYNYNKRAENRI
jgi:hypothetical protein